MEDRQIDDVAVGQTGRVALAAMPDRQIPFTVTRIVPLAQVQEGKTVFRLEASLTPGESATLRRAWRAWGASTSASAATPGSGPMASWTGCA